MSLRLQKEVQGLRAPTLKETQLLKHAIQQAEDFNKGLLQERHGRRFSPSMGIIRSFRQDRSASLFE